MFDFDKKIDRTNTYSLKWDDNKDCLPMWVADMDFECAPKIKEALLRRVNIGAYGYSLLPESLYESYISFWKDRHNCIINRDDMIFCTGVVPALSSLVRRLTRAGEKILIQSPVYNIFYNSITNNGRKILSSDLLYNDGKWTVDFKDLELKMQDPLTTMMILCNPHNPIGHIWTNEELAKIGKLAYENGVIVVSDEIHCDIVSPNKNYIPFMSVNDECKYNSVTCIAPSKCFNIAGLNTSMVVVPNKHLKEVVERGFNNDEIAENNFFAVEATVTAFNECRDYLDELNQYIYNNKLYFVNYINEYVKDLKVSMVDATYLMFVDTSKLCVNASEFTKYLLDNYKLRLSNGESYGDNSKSFFRINLATQLDNVKKACEILKEACFNFKNR